MAQVSTTHQQNPKWTTQLADSIREPQELLACLSLPDSLLPAAEKAASLFPLRVPRSFVSRMKTGDPADPLLLQVLPLHMELAPHADFSLDPVGDLAATPTPGLLHKYHGRILLITTGACAVHCRYCFRRHFPYSDQNLRGKQWQQAVDYIRNDADISEVIFSGGDPLTLGDVRLTAMVKELASITHVKRLRLHTRLPVVVPERVTAALCQLLTQTRLQPIVVIHTNHANEIDSSVSAALKKLRDANITLLNQTVLLRKINDSAAAQIALAHRLFTAGVLPYYLHMLDQVQGAAHFSVDDRVASQLMDQLRTKLPGYLVPKLVREIAGMDSKRPAEL